MNNKTSAQKVAKNDKKANENDKIGGGLLAWVIITVGFVIINFFANFANIFGWIINILLVIAIVMVLKARGSRWYMIIVGFIFGALSLWAACTISSASLCLANRRVCFEVGRAEFERMAYIGRIGSSVIAAYMFGSGIYFLLSKRVKERFSKKK